MIGELSSRCACLYLYLIRNLHSVDSRNPNVFQQSIARFVLFVRVFLWYEHEIEGIVSDLWQPEQSGVNDSGLRATSERYACNADFPTITDQL